MQIQLADIIKNIEEKVNITFGSQETICNSIEYDSRKVKKDSIFVAVKGFVSDGHDYVSKAIENGASVVVIDKSRVQDFFRLKDKNITLITVNDSREALSYLSAAFFGQVSKKIPVIGITGTNGKTSITYMLEAVFKDTGYNPGVIGTVDYRWNQTKIPAPNTTPESKDLHELMYNMFSEGVNVIIMEVSSHGLELGRVDNIDFRAAAFTNLTRDHLDFHKTFDEYFSAKKILFKLLENSSHENRFAVINIDDEYGEALYKDCQSFSFESYSVAMRNEANYKIFDNETTNTINGISYSFKTAENKYQVNLHLTAKFNIYNSLTAFAIAEKMNLEPNRIIEILENIQSIPGRFDRIKTNLGFAVVIDYAHTDDAIIKLLSSVQELNANRVITVFGCGGDRDNSKRPLMGKAAIKYSDFVIVTSDNPRTEDPNSIIDDILHGISDHKDKYHVVVNREEAIKEAIGMANTNDIVVIAGKGHENYQIIGETKIHFDDKELAKKYIAQEELK